MKAFKKPEFKINKMDELSEPVFMECSGRELFNVGVDDYQHQHYEDGRMDGVFHVDCHYTGPFFDENTTVYVTMKFDKPVEVEHWGSNIVGIVNSGLVVQGEITGENSNHFVSLGYGDVYAKYIGTYPVGTDIPAPEITFSFGPNGCY